MQGRDSINPVAPPSIVAYAQAHSVREFLLVAQAPEQQFATEEEAIYYLTHKINNVRHEDGRIYMKLTKDGQLYANSVSPYAETFFENIEPKIAPLVSALHKKRYLTYSSCEGHDYTYRRYVGLAFSDEESRDYVIDQVKALKLWGVELRKFDQVANQDIDAGRLKAHQQAPKYLGKFRPSELSQDDWQARKAAETRAFNIQFHRNYDTYFFLEIVIFTDLDLSLTWLLKNPLKSVWLYFMKKYLWDRTTQKIVTLVESEQFRKYQY